MEWGRATPPAAAGTWKPVLAPAVVRWLRDGAGSFLSFPCPA